MKKKLGVVADHRYFDHAITLESLECPARLRDVYGAIRRPPYVDHLRAYPSREIAAEELLAVHSQFYIDQIRSAGVHANPYSYDKDTYLMEDSLATAQLAAGGCLVLAEAIMSGEVDRGFALVRPPGHHADTGRGSGFCILNNVALTARYLIDRHGLERILIVDFDVHHGNGTQEIFYQEDKVLYFSIHEEHLFPFSGGVGEFGGQAGYGYNINIPIPAQYGDAEFNYIFGKAVQNIAEQYLPQIILVSAGFDGHLEERISSTRLTTGGYRGLAETLKYLAGEYGNNRLLYVLEGGYNIASLRDSILATLDALMQAKVRKPGFALAPRADHLLKKSIYKVLGEKWTIL